MEPTQQSSSENINQFTTLEEKLAKLRQNRIQQLEQATSGATSNENIKQSQQEETKSRADNLVVLTAKLPQRKTSLQQAIGSKSTEEEKQLNSKEPLSSSNSTNALKHQKTTVARDKNPIKTLASTCLDDIAINVRHPQQNTFNLNRGITISSEFDSGNLARCVQSESDHRHFTCYMSGDGLPYTNVGHYRTWFYFSVKGVQNGDTCTFAIKGMAQQGKLYKMGLRPVYRVQPNSMKWKRCSGSLQWRYDDNGFSVTFTHNFNNFNPETDTAFFAWTYPWSFQESLNQTEKLVKKFSEHQDIYIHREVLFYSRERRPMEMITFSGREKITEEREELIDGLFPEAYGDPLTRPFKFNKPTIFLSSRVHPGETPASFVLTGIWKFLTNEKSQQSKILRDRFVFKIVPMLNPDGVYRGYYRLDTMAQNLNRYYINPSPMNQPTIWAVKKAIEQQSNYGKIQIYVDLHAHASKKGCFMFGNSLQGEAQLKAMLLPKLVSMNSLNFDFHECSFSDKMMTVKDKKDGLSREGCGRVSIMKLTGLPNCYTLECNYASGRRINHLAPKLNKETGQTESETPITDPHSKHYNDCIGKQGEIRKDTAPPYTIEIFEDIGKAFCIGLLDFYNINPISRIASSNLKTVEGVKNDLLSHYPIFIPKKKEEESEAGQGKGKKSGPQRKATSLQRPSQQAPTSGKHQKLSSHGSSSGADRFQKQSSLLLSKGHLKETKSYINEKQNTSSSARQQQQMDLQGGLGSQAITDQTTENNSHMSSLNSSALASRGGLDGTTNHNSHQLATQPTDPSLFADIKNQVIVEAGEKREASPVQKREGGASNTLPLKKHQRKDKQQYPPRPNKLDRNSIAKGHKVPLPMSQMPFSSNSEMFSGIQCAQASQSNNVQNMTFEATMGLRKKHLAALYQNASETFKDDRMLRLTQAFASQGSTGQPSKATGLIARGRIEEDQQSHQQHLTQKNSQEMLPNYMQGQMPLTQGFMAINQNTQGQPQKLIEPAFDSASSHGGVAGKPPYMVGQKSVKEKIQRLKNNNMNNRKGSRTAGCQSASLRRHDFEAHQYNSQGAAQSTIMAAACAQQQTNTPHEYFGGVVSCNIGKQTTQPTAKYFLKDGTSSQTFQQHTKAGKTNDNTKAPPQISPFSLRTVTATNSSGNDEDYQHQQRLQAFLQQNPNLSRAAQVLMGASIGTPGSANTIMSHHTAAHHPHHLLNASDMQPLQLQQQPQSEQDQSSEEIYTRTQQHQKKFKHQYEQSSRSRMLNPHKNHHNDIKLFSANTVLDKHKNHSVPYRAKYEASSDRLDEQQQLLCSPNIIPTTFGGSDLPGKPAAHSSQQHQLIQSIKSTVVPVTTFTMSTGKQRPSESAGQQKIQRNAGFTKMMNSANAMSHNNRVCQAMENTVLGPSATQGKATSCRPPKGLKSTTASDTGGRKKPTPGMRRSLLTGPSTEELTQHNNIAINKHLQQQQQQQLSYMNKDQPKTSQNNLFYKQDIQSAFSSNLKQQHNGLQSQNVGGCSSTTASYGPQQLMQFKPQTGFMMFDSNTPSAIQQDFQNNQLLLQQQDSCNTPSLYLQQNDQQQMDDAAVCITKNSYNQIGAGGGSINSSGVKIKRIQHGRQSVKELRASSQKDRNKQSSRFAAELNNIVSGDHEVVEDNRSNNQNDQILLQQNPPQQQHPQFTMLSNFHQQSSSLK